MMQNVSFLDGGGGKSVGFFGWAVKTPQVGRKWLKFKV